MAKPALKFKSDDKVIRKGFKYRKDKPLTIAFIDYTRSVYIFEEPWIHNGDKYSNMDFAKAEELFKLKE